MRTFFFTASLMGVLLSSAGGQAQGSVPSCRSVLADTSIESSLVVPRGQTCTISNTMVKGNILVERGATLFLRSTNVKGNVTTAAGFRQVALAGSILEGELRAERGGNVSLDDSQVLGNVNINGNQGVVQITRVTLNRNLNCANNTRRPTGTWIRVDGRQTGQCSRI